MGLLILLCGMYFVAIAENVIAGGIVWRHTTPGLLALWAIVWVACRRAPGRGAPQMSVLGAALIGLVFDLNSGGRLGVGMAAFALMAFALEQLGPRFRRLDPLLRTLATAPLVAVLMLLVLVGNVIAGEPTPPAPTAFIGVLSTAASTSIVSFPVWMAAAWLIQPKVGRALRA